ncbi:hypothetical protein D1AOALGA4SA_11975, partial [Olavius algarvensis Delta 1 endosymbiont]
YYQHTFTQDSRGINYLTNDRGITDNQSLKDFAVGYANGTLLEILPEDPDVTKALKKIGILNGKGIKETGTLFGNVKISKARI